MYWKFQSFQLFVTRNQFDGSLRPIINLELNLKHIESCPYIRTCVWSQILVYKKKFLSTVKKFHSTMKKFQSAVKKFQSTMNEFSISLSWNFIVDNEDTL